MRRLVPILCLALLPACATFSFPKDSTPQVGGDCVVEGDEALTPGGHRLLRASEPLRRCAVYDFPEMQLVIAETRADALLFQWGDDEPFRAAAADVELVQHVWAREDAAPARCAFPGESPERATVEVPIYLGRGVAKQHLSAPGWVYTPGPPGASACRRVFVGTDPVAFATHGVPTGQEGRLVAVENAGGWTDFEHVPTAQEAP